MKTDVSDVVSGQRAAREITYKSALDVESRCVHYACDTVMSLSNPKSLAEALGTVDLHADNAPCVTDDFESLGPLDATKIVNSADYRYSIFLRVRAGTLPPAVECRLLDLALGKPVTRVTTETIETPFESATIEDIEERELLLLADLRRRKLTNGAVPRSTPREEPDPPTPLVH